MDSKTNLSKSAQFRSKSKKYPHAQVTLTFTNFSGEEGENALLNDCLNQADSYLTSKDLKEILERHNSKGGRNE